MFLFQKLTPTISISIIIYFKNKTCIILFHNSAVNSCPASPKQVKKNAKQQSQLNDVQMEDLNRVLTAEESKVSLHFLNVTY